MMQRQARMVQQHSGTRVPHDHLDFFLHIRAVAVNKAFAASAFFVLKRALVKAQKRIFFELRAFRAEFAVCSMMASAKYFDHIAYGFLFPFHSLVFRVRGLRLQINRS